MQPLWKTVWRFLRKLKIELPYDPAILLLGTYPEKTIIQKESCTTMVIAALFTVARTWKQPKCPSTDEWIKKMYIYSIVYMSMPLSHFIPAYPSPSPCPQVHSLRLRFYSCPGPGFIRIFFLASMYIC